VGGRHFGQRIIGAAVMMSMAMGKLASLFRGRA